MRKLRILLLLGAVLLEAGCGLPDTYFIGAPTAGIVTPGVSLQFYNHDPSHDINVNFVGVEVYYKFYAASVDIEGTAYDSSNPVDASAQLLAKGFHAVCPTTGYPNVTDPLIPAGGNSILVRIAPSSSASTDSNYSIDGGATVEIRRNTSTTDLSAFKTFQDHNTLPGNFASTDADIGLALYNAMFASGQIYMAFYAISYGQVIGTKTPVRSAATYLGYLLFTFYHPP